MTFFNWGLKDYVDGLLHVDEPLSALRTGCISSEHKALGMWLRVSSQEILDDVTLEVAIIFVSEEKVSQAELLDTGGRVLPETLTECTIYPSQP